MICNRCTKQMFMQAFSEGNCYECGEHITHHVTPCAKVCKKCSDKFSLCETCGYKWGQIFLVWVDGGVYDEEFRELYGVRSTRELAIELEAELRHTQDIAKWRYERDYGSNYNEDMQTYYNSDGENEDLEEKIADQVILYRAKYPFLKYELVLIEEKEYK